MRKMCYQAAMSLITLGLLFCSLAINAGCSQNDDDSKKGSLNDNGQNSKEEFHVYLCFGQSNMEGAAQIEDEDRQDVDSRFMVMHCTDCSDNSRSRGRWYKAVPPLTRCSTGLSPADYFGRTMVENLPENIKVGIINVAVGGCRIELFDRVNYGQYIQESPDWLRNIVKEYDNNPYKRLVDMAKKAQKDGAVIKGILMHQGESNGGDAQWAEKVKSVYENILEDIDMSSADVPLLVGEVVGKDQNGTCAGMNDVIATLPSLIPDTYVISSRGCEGASDNLHFSPKGYRELGKRYATQMLSILKERED